MKSSQHDFNVDKKAGDGVVTAAAAAHGPESSTNECTTFATINRDLLSPALVNEKVVQKDDSTFFSTVDLDRLSLAIDDHAKTVSDIKSHRLELENLQGQIKELNAEISSIQLLVRDFDLANNSISMGELKDFANRKHRAKLELETLIEVRDELKKRYPVMERDYSYLDSTSERDAKRFCWSVLYDSLLSAIDVEQIKQLIVVGVAAGWQEKAVLTDLGLMTVEYQRLESLAKQFSIPV